MARCTDASRIAAAALARWRMAPVNRAARHGAWRTLMAHRVKRHRRRRKRINIRSAARYRGGAASQRLAYREKRRSRHRGVANEAWRGAKRRIGIVAAGALVIGASGGGGRHGVAAGTRLATAGGAWRILRRHRGIARHLRHMRTSQRRTSAARCCASLHQPWHRGIMLLRRTIGGTA